jgi:peptide chain release factor 1
MRWFVNISAAETGLSSVLLNRARAVADEHASLCARLAVSFDIKTAKRVAELVPVTNVLKEWDNANEVSHIYNFLAITEAFLTD